MSDDMRPASFFNKQPILDVVKRFVPAAASGNWLELASGLGEHAAHFGEAFPSILFLPTDVDPAGFGDLVAATRHLHNVRPPVRIDCATSFDEWRTAGITPASFEFACCINMVHISPWACTLGLFAGVSQALQPNGILFTYGPYNVDGKFTHESNEAFDKSLKGRNPAWGVRDIGDLEAVAAPHGMTLEARVPMPHDNFTLVWRKTGAASATL